MSRLKGPEPIVPYSLPIGTLGSVLESVLGSEVNHKVLLRFQ